MYMASVGARLRQRIMGCGAHSNVHMRLQSVSADTRCMLTGGCLLLLRMTNDPTTRMLPLHLEIYSGYASDLTSYSEA